MRSNTTGTEATAVETKYCRLFTPLAVLDPCQDISAPVERLECALAACDNLDADGKVTRQHSAPCLNPSERCKYEQIETAIVSARDTWDSYYDKLCSEGYEGSLCGKCRRTVTNGAKYGQRRAWVCVKCEGNAKLSFALSCLLTSVAMALTANLSLSNNLHGFRDGCYTSDIGKVSCARGG